MRYTLLISLLMMLTHTTGLTETTNNLVSQDFTSGWTNTGNYTHDSNTIAGIHDGTVESDSVSLNTDVGLNQNEINEGFTINSGSSIWFWNSYDQSVTMTTKAIDSDGQTITQNRLITNPLDGSYYTSYTDKMIFNSNIQKDYDLSLKFSFSVTDTLYQSGHYGADLKDPSMTVTYTPVSIDSAVESKLIALIETLEEDIFFEEFTFEETIEVKEEPILDTKMDTEKEPVFEEIVMVKEENEEKPMMEMIETFAEEKNEEESNSETTETADATQESNSEQKEVQQKETKTVRLTEVLEKIDEQIKDIDKNLQLKNLVKLKIMSEGNILEAYNIPFYESKDIYLDQIDMTDDRIIYTNDLVQYKQNDPIFIQKQKLNSILQKRQNLISELEALKNG